MISSPQVTRHQRARVYAAALSVCSFAAAEEAATFAAARFHLGRRAEARLVCEALRYAEACDGIWDRLAARVALGYLVDGSIPGPRFIRNQARRIERRMKRRRG